MVISSRARLSVLGLAGALSLALVTGCGGGGSDEKSGASAAPSASAPSSAPAGKAPAGKALSEEELTALVVAPGDVEGFKVAEPGEGDVFGGSWEDVRIEGGAGCDPLVRVLSGSPVGDPAEHVARQATQERAGRPAEGDAPSFADAMKLDVTMVTLAAYDGDGAERAVTSVRDAVEACSGGFTFTLPGEDPAAYSEVATEAGVPVEDGADDSVAFGLTGQPFEAGGPNSSVHGQVVRHGNLVAAYVTVNIGKMSEGTRYQVSAPVVTAQTAKLG